MKHLVFGKFDTHKKEKIFSWIKLLSITGGAQIAIQILSFISGILVIRLLNVKEYAFYTIANTMLGMLNVLSDGGISTGVMSQGGKVWQDRNKLGIVLITGLQLRKRFAIYSIIISTPVLIYLLMSNGANIFIAVLIALSLIPAFYAALSDSLFEIAPKLNQDIIPLQKNQLSVSFGRLILSGISLVLIPWSFAAILASGIPRIWGNFKLKQISGKFADDKQSPDINVKKDILSIVRGILPGAVYYSVSGQITIWIISIAGNTSEIAEIGALNRYSAIMPLFYIIFSTLLIPRFARLKNDYKKLIKFSILFFSILVLLSIFIITIFGVFSTEALWILGAGYAALQFQLVLFIIGTCIGMFTGMTYSLCISRGWILNPYIYISINLSSIVLGILLFNVSTLTGVLYLNIFTNLIHFAIYFIYLFLRIHRIKYGLVN